MKFTEYIQKNKKNIQLEKNKILSAWMKKINKQIPDFKVLSKLLIESNSGGKNIRGSLICLGYELFSKTPQKNIYIIAAAYEILHTSLLIHDDIIDKSILRRGDPSLFQKLGGDHYGISQAICLGDVGFFLAIKAINETAFSSEIKSKIISYFSQIVLDTITGQMLDVELSNAKTDVSEKNVITISQLKTARYTISGPLLLGALLAEADEKTLKKISIFGEQLGIGFQIKDDLLGIFGNAKKLGKSVTSDIEEGKNTLLILYARSHGTKEQKEIIDNYYGKGKIIEKEYKLIKQVLQETGAYEYGEKKIEEYTKKASLLIPQITSLKSLQFLLKDFINYLIKRDK